MELSRAGFAVLEVEVFGNDDDAGAVALCRGVGSGG